MIADFVEARLAADFSEIVTAGRIVLEEPARLEDECVNWRFGPGVLHSRDGRANRLLERPPRLERRGEWSKGFRPDGAGGDPLFEDGDFNGAHGRAGGHGEFDRRRGGRLE